MAKNYSASLLQKIRDLKSVSVKNRSYSRLLPKIYTNLVLWGFALTGLQSTFLPQLVICSSLFGENSCDPAGNFVITIASIPSYLFTGLIVSKIPNSQAYMFFLVMFIFSLLIYWLLGKLLDRVLGRKLTSLEWSLYILWSAIVLLIIFLISLI